ncbi:Zn-dependent metalloprotease [Actinokineospora baliensis]|uniref:M28 family peptidase n=1 Tax=Actinokineospora baliensis TaxID=547056 RepID=UPI0019588E2C|nr:M28 family peptidase [Actinokineospora baliensis]MBM7774026.1 Zn-dependent metalloprotease [Actinokineospora baliensis]
MTTKKTVGRASRLTAVLGVAVCTAALGAVALAQQAPPEPAGTPEEVAIAAADRALGGQAGLAGISGDDRFVRADVESTRQGLTYVSYTREFQGLPVFNGGDVVVVVDATGSVRDVGGDNRRAAPRSTRPGVTARTADTVARAHFTGVVRSVSAPRLGIDLSAEPRLAWEVVVTGERRDITRGAADLTPSALHVFVEANTGVVTGSWDAVAHAEGKGHHNGTVQIGTQQSGSGYQMKDPDRGGQSVANDGSKAIYTDSDDMWGNGGANDLPSAAVDVQYAQNKMWDMLKEKYGRNGHDGNGQWPEAHVGMNEGNAYSFCTNSAATDYTRFGRNSRSTLQLTAMDVVGHENGHSIDCRTPGGMSRQGEAYGIGESMGDILGALLEHYANNPNDAPDYLVGEKVDFSGNGSALRNMYDPAKLGDPSCWKSGLPAEHGSGGPQNHWFYLLAEGSSPGGGKPNSPTCNSSTVTGIGVWKAGDIFYHSLLRKTSNWSYAKARTATLQAAKDLYPNSCVEFDTAKAAWTAVSVPAQSNEPTCTGTPPTSTTRPTMTTTTTMTTPPTTTTTPPTTTVPDIDVARVKAHVDQFQAIAEQNSGNRAGGSAGHQASLRYVQGKLDQAGYTTRVHEFSYQGRTGRNLIADLPGRGDPNQVVMLGSHLDGVSAGPGINDNASGSSVTLEVALAYATSGAKGDKAIRFGWWDFEEAGLIGSAQYVRSLSSADRAKIKNYLNFDMVGSPNGGYFINNITTESGKALKAYYDSIGVQTEENTEGAGRSDDKSFKDAGIATSGVAAGASNRMTAAQAGKWGGQSGVAFDKCYHQSCDTKANINPTVLDRSADAAAHGAWMLTGADGGPTTTPTTTRPTTTNTTTPPPTCSLPAWDAAELYWAGSQVQHNGRKWTAMTFSYDDEPGVAGPWGNPWQDNGSC